MVAIAIAVVEQNLQVFALASLRGDALDLLGDEWHIGRRLHVDERLDGHIRMVVGDHQRGAHVAGRQNG